MQRSYAVADLGSVRGARVGIVASAGPEISAIEEALREAGAEVQLLRPGYVGGLREGSHDAVIVRVNGPDVAEASGAARRRNADLEALVSHQRVIALVDESIGSIVPGVRDFVSAPFRASEVVARLARVLREPAPEVRLSAGNLELHATNRTVTIDGQPVNVTYNEFEILRALLAADSGVVSRQSIARRADAADLAAVRWVDIHIHRLRTKLRELQGARIDTVRGVGYRISR